MEGITETVSLDLKEESNDIKRYWIRDMDIEDYMMQWTWSSPVSGSLVTVLTPTTSAFCFLSGDLLGLTGALTGDFEGVNSSSA